MPLESPVGRRFRVGLVVLVALLLMMFGVLMVGRRKHLFTAKLPYRTQFDSAAGLVPGPTSAASRACWKTRWNMCGTVTTPA